MKMPIATASSPGSIALPPASAVLASRATRRSEVRLESTYRTEAKARLSQPPF